MSHLITHDPFAEMRAFVRRAFDDGSPRWLEADGPRRASRRAALTLDVYHADGGLTVEAVLPGFRKDELDVTLVEGMLAIRAAHEDESESPADDAGRRYVVRERGQGAVSRRIWIGESYDPDSVSGALKHGVLTLAIKKLPEAQPKPIAIEGE